MYFCGMPVALYQYLQSIRVIPPSAALARVITGFYIMPAGCLPANGLAISDGMPAMAFLPHADDQLRFSMGQTTVTVTGGWVSGPYLEKAWLQVPQSCGPLLVVQFNPVWFYQLWQLLPQRLRRAGICSLPDIPGKDGMLLLQLVSGASSITDKIKVLETFIMDRLPRQPSHNGLLEEAITCIREREKPSTVQELGRLLGVNYKWLERNFRSYTGLSPKEYMQQYRFLQTCVQLQDGVPVDFMGIALQQGYYDQNHLIKDFKKFTGMSPGKYLKAYAFSSASSARPSFHLLHPKHNRAATAPGAC